MMNFDPWILLLFLPAAASFFWLLLNRFLASGTNTYLILQFLAVDLTLFFLSDAFYAVPGIPSELLVFTHLVSLATGPSVVPLIWMYFHKLRHRATYSTPQLLWLIIPVALVFSGTALTSTIGVERLAAFLDDLISGDPNVLDLYQGTALGHYYIWTHIVFRGVVMAELVVAAVYLAFIIVKEKVSFKNYFAYERHDASIRQFEIQLFTLIIPAAFLISKVSLPKYYLDDHLWVSIIQAVVVTWGYFSFMLHSLAGERKTITKIQFRHIMMYNYNPSTKGPIIEIMMEELLEDAEQDALVRLHGRIGESIQTADDIHPKEISAVKEMLFGAVANSWDDSLLTRFQTLMLNEQLFLQPGLSLQDMAQKLHTNKTYVSKLVNNTYNMGFPELLNTLRIDYAEQYIMNHPNARQEEIAKACGFLSASSFNNIFRKITGMTPKMWMLSMDNKRNAQ